MTLRKGLNWDALTKDAFQDVAEAERFLPLLRESQARLAERLSHQVTVLFGLLALFELLRSHAGELSFGPLQSVSTDAVFIALPAIIAFLFHDAIDMTIHYQYHGEVTSALYGKFWPALWERDFERLVQPRLPGLWPWGGLSQRSASKFSIGVRMTLALLTVLAPLLYLSYAAGVLMARYGALHGGVALSLSIAAISMLIAFASLVLFFREMP